MVNLVLRYSLFAAMAMLVNLSAQYLTFWFYRGIYDIYLAIAVGTISGLILKYILDKKYIFYYFSAGVKDDFKKFILYSTMGVITTLIFWGSELAFNAVFDFTGAKYIGALVGLTAGYIIKYNLDKKYVFK